MTVFLDALFFVLENKSQFWHSRDCLTDGLLINCPRIVLLFEFADSACFLWSSFGKKVSHLGNCLFFRPFGLTVFSLWFLFVWCIIILSSRNLYFFFYDVLSSSWLQLVLNCFLRTVFFPAMLEFIRTFVPICYLELILLHALKDLDFKKWTWII